ncbi:MAG: type II toxin-antitoxin system RelE/ParE family toxin [Bacteroidetes bacterium]|nr:type II toxin-antitoxin system RelE/ParE family toxin [Bacteroidota bacterium]
MQVEFLAKFNRDLDRIHLKSVKSSIAETIDAVKTSNSITQISNIKKLKGFRSAYRIRIGEYRIGIFVEGSHVEFARVLHRKEIYRYFP